MQSHLNSPLVLAIHEKWEVNLDKCENLAFLTGPQLSPARQVASLRVRNFRATFTSSPSTTSVAIFLSIIDLFQVIGFGVIMHVVQVVLKQLLLIEFMCTVNALVFLESTIF